MGDTEKRVTAKYILDTSGFNNSIKGVNNELKNNQSALKLANTNLKAFGTDSTKLKAVQQELAKQVELHAKKVDIYKQSLEKATEKMNSNISARDNLKNEIDQEKTKLEAAIQTYGEENEVTQNLKTKIAALTEEYEKKEKAVETNARSIQNYETQMNNANSQLSRTQGQLQKVNQQLAESNSKWLSASETLKKSSEKLKNIGSGVSSAGDSILKVTAPMLAAGAGALKVSSDFESGMSQVAATMGFTTEQIHDKTSQQGQDFEKLSQAAKDMGATTQYSATEASEALNYLALAGYDTDTAISTLPNVLNLAAAGGMDLGTACDMATDAASALGLKTEEMSGFIDSMARTSQKSNTSVSQLGEAILTVGGSANTLKGGVNEMNTALGILANVGYKGAEGGTHLRNAILSLSAPTDTAATALESLGVETEDANGNLLGLDDIMGQLNTKLSMYGSAEKASWISKIFNKTDIAAVNGLLASTAHSTDELKGVMEQTGYVAENYGHKWSDVASSYDKAKDDTTNMNILMRQFGMTQEQAGIALEGLKSVAGDTTVWSDLSSKISDCDGAAGDMAKTMMDNLQGQWTLFKSQLEGVGIQLGQTILPMAKKALDVVSKWLDAFSKLSPETQENIVKMVAFSVATGGVLKVVGGGITTIGNVVGAFSKLSGVIGTATVATEAAATATEGVAAAGAVAGGAGGMGALVAGFGSAVVAAAPFIAAGAAVAAAGYGIYKGMTQEVVPSVDLFADKVNYASTQVQNANGNMSATTVESVTKISEATKTAVQSYLDMDESAKAHIQDLYINSAQITDQIVSDSKTKFDDMSKSIVNGYEQQKNDSVAKLQELFTKQSTLTDEEQTAILQKTNDYYTNKENTTQQYEAQIMQILQDASNQKRELTSDEVNTITDLQNKMRENAVHALSQQETEAAVILQRMKDYDGRITAEQAAEHIKKLNESRDGAVKAANDEYDKNIATITKMRDETGSITKEQADKMIAEAKRQRDDTVKAAEDTRDKAVDKIKGMNKDIETSVDTSTGKILTWWDKLKRWWTGWQPENKQFNYTTTESKKVDANWTGNESFKGGLTTLHERGYELYDLPSKTRIYNHEASEDLVLKTAESVANRVANQIYQNNSSKQSENMTIIVPVNLDGREIARVSAPYVSEELAFNTERGI